MKERICYFCGEWIETNPDDYWSHSLSSAIRCHGEFTEAIPSPYLTAFVDEDEEL